MKQRGGPLCPCCRRDFVIDPLDDDTDENVIISNLTNNMDSEGGISSLYETIGSDTPTGRTLEATPTVIDTASTVVYTAGQYYR